tara:strand:- start:927 stop:1316 length:390 start_codon:yes stop_codon:yes gene_type:complete
MLKERQNLDRSSSVFKFLKSLVDSEVMGEEIVNKNVKTYFLAKKMHPNLTSLDWLMATYLGRMQARGISPEQCMADAEYHCNIFNKISEPQNARALGLSMLMQERPDIIRDYPKFMNEIASIMPPNDRN